MSMRPSGAVADAQAAVAFARQCIAERGDVRLRASRLWVGDRPLLGDTSLVDAVEADTGFGCTIFRGNLRVATTALAPGGTNRALGTRASPAITQQVYRCGLRFTGITRIIGSDWFIVYEPLREPSSRIVGMVACFRDVHHYAEDLTALDALDEAIFLHRDDGEILAVSARAADMTGRVRDALVGSPLSRHVSTRGRADSDEDALNGTCLHRDGQRFPVGVTSRALRDDPTRRLTVVRDLTLPHPSGTSGPPDPRPSTSEWAMQCPDGILLTDESGAILTVNASFRAMLGASGAALAPGQPVSRLGPRVSTLVVNVFSSRQTRTIELPLPDGGVAEARCSPVIATTGPPACIGTTTIARRSRTHKTLIPPLDP